MIASTPGFNVRLPLGQRLVRKLKRLAGQNEDRFLQSVSGLVHVGANLGQERDDYARRAINVVWVEPIPDIFNRLQANLQGFKDQRAVQALVTDTVGKQYEFNVASNDGASSSILPPEQHRDLWPEVEFNQKLLLQSTTLDQLLFEEQIQAGSVDALVMDTQGSELLVLKGATQLLESIRYIKIEAADFESYAGCCTRKELDDYLTTAGFKLIFSEPFAHGEGVGSYYTLVYSR